MNLVALSPNGTARRINWSNKTRDIATLRDADIDPHDSFGWVYQCQNTGYVVAMSRFRLPGTARRNHFAECVLVHLGVDVHCELFGTVVVTTAAPNGQLRISAIKVRDINRQATRAREMCGL